MTLAGDQEVLEREGGRSLPRPARRLLLAAVVLVVTAGSVDAVLREQEGDAVAGCAAEARASVTEADRKQSFMADYLAPAFYTVPAEGGRESFYAMMAEQVDKTRPVLERARRACADIQVAPWHASLRERRAAFRDYLDARIAWAERVAADGRVFYHDDEQLESLRDAAFGD